MGRSIYYYPGDPAPIPGGLTPQQDPPSIFTQLYSVNEYSNANITRLTLNDCFLEPIESCKKISQMFPHIRHLILRGIALTSGDINELALEHLASLHWNPLLFFKMPYRVYDTRCKWTDFSPDHQAHPEHLTFIFNTISQVQFGKFPNLAHLSLCNPDDSTPYIACINYNILLHLNGTLPITSPQDLARPLPQSPLQTSHAPSGKGKSDA